MLGSFKNKQNAVQKGRVLEMKGLVSMTTGIVTGVAVGTAVGNGCKKDETVQTGLQH